MENSYKGIDIIENVYEGYGLGKLPDGKVVFLPFAVTGDNVDIRITDDKKRYAYGEIIAINKKSDKRVEGFCKYEGLCGGCTFAMIDDEYEETIKRTIVKKFFRFIDNFEINSYIKSSTHGYRIRGRFKISNGKLGFYKFGSHQFLEIDSCPVMKPSILEKPLEVAKYYTFDDVTELSIIENSDGEQLTFLHTDRQIEFPEEAGVITRFSQGTKDYIFINVGGYKIPAHAKGFFQTNRYIMEDFQKIVTSSLENCYKILELYCGSGFFTIPLWEKGKKITALDNDRRAIELLGGIIGNKRCKCIDIDRDIKKIAFNFDAILMDPDRNGLSKNVIDYLNENKPTLVVYVSCNPVTMARDIKLLGENYKLDKFYIIDQFPATYHIESIAVLSKH
ncbi:MAG: TRAM domain-containing protein [Calditerrivibrio sp.]|nr:TRAM domain-containing protein [Calditerrivibrio sp.]MCA1980517.1 TRAM domain-containing protein [Calditerrivibrio sp.]